MLTICPLTAVDWGPTESIITAHCTEREVVRRPDVDDEKWSRDRVALAHEEIESYDASYYETQLVRAVESVLSPLGWDRTEIQQELAGTREPELTDFQ